MTALNKKMVLIANPELVNEVMKSGERRVVLEPARYYKLQKNLVMTPIETYYNENWQDVRQLFNVAMKPENLEQILFPQLSELNSDFLQIFLRNATAIGEDKYSVADIMQVSNNFAFNSVVKAFVGVKMTPEYEKQFGFTIEQFIADSVRAVDLILKLNNFPIPIYKYYKIKDYKEFERLMDETIIRSDKIVNSLQHLAPKDKPRLLEMIHERAQGMPRSEEMVGLVLNSFLAAAVDITSRTISILMYRLAHEPEYQEKLFEECVKIFGEPTVDELTSSTGGLNVTYQQYKQATLVRHFIEESMRLNHVTDISSMRIIDKDTVIGGYTLPADTGVLIVQNQEFFNRWVPKHLEFIPERYEKGNESCPSNKNVSLVFGKGARKCPGERVASTELFLSVVNTVRSFKVSKTVKEFPPFEASQSILYIDTKKYPLLIEPREHLKEAAKLYQGKLL